VISVTKLKIGNVEDEKPVNLNIKLPAGVHRDLVAYAEILKRNGGQAIDPGSLVAAMLARFMATDRAFRKERSEARQAKRG
jgi:hypothetical protein